MFPVSSMIQKISFIILFISKMINISINMDTLPSTFRYGCQPSTPDINPPRPKTKPPPSCSFSFTSQKSDLPTYFIYHPSYIFILYFLLLFYIYLNFLQLDLQHFMKYKYILKIDLYSNNNRQKYNF